MKKHNRPASPDLAAKIEAMLEAARDANRRAELIDRRLDGIELRLRSIELEKMTAAPSSPPADRSGL